jgi:hypothetical protein
MIQVSIKKQEQITNQASFQSMEEAQAWLSHHEGMKSFGQPKQIIQQQIELSPPVLDEEGIELSPAETEMKEVELAGEYEVEIIDISAEFAQEKINAEAQAFLDSTDFKVLRHIRQKSLGQQLSLSEDEYLALEQERSDAAERIVK